MAAEEETEMQTFYYYLASDVQSDMGNHLFYCLDSNLHIFNNKPKQSCVLFGSEVLMPAKQVEYAGLLTDS